MFKKLRQMKNKIKGHLPVSRSAYATTLTSVIKLLEAEKESSMLLRNDVYQLGKTVHEIKNGVEGEDKDREDNIRGMFE